MMSTFVMTALTGSFQLADWPIFQRTKFTAARIFFFCCDEAATDSVKLAPLSIDGML